MSSALLEHVRIAALAIEKVVAMSRSTPSRLFVPFYYYKMYLIIAIHKINAEAWEAIEEE